MRREWAVAVAAPVAAAVQARLQLRGTRCCRVPAPLGPRCLSGPEECDSFHWSRSSPPVGDVLHRVLAKGSCAPPSCAWQWRRPQTFPMKTPFIPGL